VVGVAVEQAAFLAALKVQHGAFVPDDVGADEHLVIEGEHKTTPLGGLRLNRRSSAALGRTAPRTACCCY
jgi:hypothetical protein